MRPQGFKRPGITAGDLNTPIRFVGYKPAGGLYPGEKEPVTLYEAFARIDKIWTRDVPQAIADGTLQTAICWIRDPMGDYMPERGDVFEIDAQVFRGQQFRVEDVAPDLQQHRLVRIVGTVKT